MPHVTTLKRFVLTLAGLLTASAAQAQDLDDAFFGGGYAPAPGYAYQGYGEGARVGLGPDAYDQGYTYGGYQYPAGLYGGGDYRRAGYSAADVYVGYPPPYGRVHAPPYPVYRPYARHFYAPAPGYYGAPAPVRGGFYSAGYRPYRALRQHCRCVLY